jgi:hypothetical protein
VLKSSRCRDSLQAESRIDFHHNSFFNIQNRTVASQLLYENGRSFHSTQATKYRAVSRIFNLNKSFIRKRHRLCWSLLVEPVDKVEVGRHEGVIVERRPVVVIQSVLLWPVV